MKIIHRRKQTSDYKSLFEVRSIEILLDKSIIYFRINYTMNSNTILFISIALLLLLVSSSQGKGVFTKSDDDFEVSQQTATTFLSMDEDFPPIIREDPLDIFLKREASKNCVPCKFGINPCCAPNICVKKTLRPDECQEVKTGQ